MSETRSTKIRSVIDELRGSAIQVLQNIAKTDRIANETVDREFEKSVSELLSLGLVRGVLTREGTTYEITESGSRFLEEYESIVREPEVTVVIPTMNEVESIGQIVSHIPYGWEVILVDLSTDGTAQEALKLRPDIRIIRRGPREVGKGAALRLGLREARGGIVVMMDGDGSHQTSELVKLVSTLEAQNADLVQASRMLRANGSMEMGPHDQPLRFFGNKIVTFLINMLFRSSITDSQYGLRALRKEFISKLSLRSNDWDIETEILARAAKCRGKIVEIPSVELRRKNGVSHLDVLNYARVVGRRFLVEIFCR